MDALFWFIIGYCAAVIFPVPWVSRFVLDMWSRMLGAYETVKARYK